MRGKGGNNENRRKNAEKAYGILNEKVIQYDWEKKMIISIPKIKLFFSKTPEKWTR